MRSTIASGLGFDGRSSTVCNIRLPQDVPPYQWGSLKREELIATNSMVLHEFYFGNLGGRRATAWPSCGSNRVLLRLT